MLLWSVARCHLRQSFRRFNIRIHSDHLCLLVHVVADCKMVVHLHLLLIADVNCIFLWCGWLPLAVERLKLVRFLLFDNFFNHLRLSIYGRSCTHLRIKSLRNITLVFALLTHRIGCFWLGQLGTWPHVGCPFFLGGWRSGNHGRKAS